MAKQSEELLGKTHDGERLTPEKVRSLGSEAATENPTPVLREEFQGGVFRFANRDDASGCLARNTEETGRGTTPISPRRT